MGWLDKFDKAQDGQKVSTSSPEYKKLYDAGKVARYDRENNIYNMPTLPEVTVTAPNESLRYQMGQKSNKFLQDAMGVMGAAQTVPMELITGKQQTPSEAWGFDTTNKPWYHPKSLSNFAMDAGLDPLNFFSIGLIDDLGRGVIRNNAQKAISKTLYNSISPWDYSAENILRMPQNFARSMQGKNKVLAAKLRNILADKNDWRSHTILGGAGNRDDAFATYLGLSPKNKSLQLKGSDELTGLSKYELTNPVPLKPRYKPDLNAPESDFRNAELFAQARMYNQSITRPTKASNSTRYLDLNTPGSSITGADHLYGVMGGFKKYVSPDGKNVMYRDVWDLQPFQRNEKLPKFIRDFEVSSVIPGAKPFVAEGKLADIKTKFFPAQFQPNTRQMYTRAKRDVISIFDPSDMFDTTNPTPDMVDEWNKFVRQEAKRMVERQIGDKMNSLRGVSPFRDSYKYADTSPYIKIQKGRGENPFRVREPEIGSMSEVKANGLDSRLFTRPLTLVHDLIYGKSMLGTSQDPKWYRKQGSSAGLKSIIKEQGITAPGPYRTKGGVDMDSPAFSLGSRPNENYGGVFAVEFDYPKSTSVNSMSNWAGGVKHYGSFPYSNSEGLMRKIPLDDPGVNIYRRRFLSNNYRKLDKNNLEKELRTAKLQDGTEKAFKWGVRGAGAKYLFDKFNGEDKKQHGGIVKDNQGYWNPENWGKPVQIDSNQITMRGVNQPLLGISDEGDVQYMKPGKDYKFKGKKVTEFPIAQNGFNVAIEDVKQFYRDYYDSPKYKERYLKSFPDSGSAFLDATYNHNRAKRMMQDMERLKDSPQSSKPYMQGEILYYASKEVDDRAKAEKKFKKPALNFMNDALVVVSPNTKSHYNPKINRSYVNAKELWAMPHEVSHSVTYPNALGKVPIPLRTIKTLRSLAKDVRDKHDADPYETKADVDTLRYQLFKKGIYDARTEDFTEDHLKKIEEKGIGNPFYLNRLKRIYGKDFIKVMNIIAKNSSSEEKELTTIAQDGTQIPYAQPEYKRMFSNYKFSDPKPSAHSSEFNKGEEMVVEEKEFIKNWMDSDRFKTKLVENLKEIDDKRNDPKYKGWLDKHFYSAEEDAKKYTESALEGLENVKVFGNPNPNERDKLSKLYSDEFGEDEYETLVRKYLSEGIYKPYNKTIWLNTNGSDTQTHELVHSTNLDNVLKNIAPVGQSKIDLLEEYRKEYSEIDPEKIQLGYHFFTPALYKDNNSIFGEREVLLKGKELEKDAKKKGFSIDKLEYINQTNEVYPRIMAIRKVANISPNEVITKERMEEIYRLTQNDEIYDVYSKEQVRKLLNKLASNDSSSSQRPMAQSGGTLKPSNKSVNSKSQSGWLDKYQ